jgi:hypothetical protein
MGHNAENLAAHILPMSRSQVFPVACKEWAFESAYISPDWDSCPCGQDIKEQCYIRNRLTGHTTYVGNVCVNRFMGMNTGTLFAGLRRIALDINANANAAVIDYANARGYIYGPAELKFLLSMRNTRIATAKQAAWRAKINRRILGQIVVKR